jgi:hypothetical protein
MPQDARRHDDRAVLKLKSQRQRREERKDVRIIFALFASSR